MLYSVLYSVVNTCLQVLQLTAVGVVTEIGLLVLQCVEEVLKPKPRHVLTLSHDLAEKTVLERVPTPETATHIPVKVFNISPYGQSIHSENIGRN